MKLNETTLFDKEYWQRNDTILPRFERTAVKKYSQAFPGWIHFGPGNIFRAHIAALQQTLLDKGLSNYGIIAAAPNSAEIIEQVYRPHDDLTLLITMLANGDRQKKIIASITESLSCLRESKDWQRLETIFTAESLQIVSFTITEKGYKVKDSQGELLSQLVSDQLLGPLRAQSFFGKIAALLCKRFTNGEFPITLLSLDNCSSNGDILRTAILTIAEAWAARRFVSAGFIEYLQAKVSYPCSMIDKITPRPSAAVQQELQEAGLSDMTIIHSARGGQYAPFVNAEKAEYLVIEDNFANGRPPLEAAGVIFTDRETVAKAERMKVCTCLNPLHTALAVYGCLLGYDRIAAEMQDRELKALVNNIGMLEGLKVVADPGVISPKEFLQECLTERFPNKAIPDTPQRIACDTSQKLAVRFGETIKAYGNKAGELVYIPLAIAGWLRYLLGVDDQGNKFMVSPDPLLDDLNKYLNKVDIYHNCDNIHALLLPILADRQIFGSDLYANGLGTKIEKYFTELITGEGAVRQTLKKYLANK